MTPEEIKNAKSAGHLVFWRDFEFYAGDGHVYRARRSDPILTGGTRYGRWECSKVNFERYKSVIMPEYYV